MAVSPQYDPIPETAEAALALWDNGDPVFTLELGGLGPGYEQTIHILVFELVRDLQGQPMPDEANWSTWGDETIARANKALGRWGFSGAQVGAAKQFAHAVLRDGWRPVVRRRGFEDDPIQVQRGYPTELPRP